MFWTANALYRAPSPFVVQAPVLRAVAPPLRNPSQDPGTSTVCFSPTRYVALKGSVSLADAGVLRLFIPMIIECLKVFVLAHLKRMLLISNACLSSQSKFAAFHELLSCTLGFHSVFMTRLLPPAIFQYCVSCISLFHIRE